MAKDRINELATRIYEALKAKGADIGNASVPIIEAELEHFVSDIRQAAAQDAYEQAANLLFRHVYHSDFEQCSMDECGNRCKEIAGTAGRIRALAAAEKEGEE